jgi:hypothetical protein
VPVLETHDGVRDNEAADAEKDDNSEDAEVEVPVNPGIAGINSLSRNVLEDY